MTMTQAPDELPQDSFTAEVPRELKLRQIDL